MLKIKLDVSTEKEEEIKETLEKLGIIISDDADYVLSENMENSHIVCKKGEQIHQIPIAEIVYIESQDHYLIIRTKMISIMFAKPFIIMKTFAFGFY